MLVVNVFAMCCMCFFLLDAMQMNPTMTCEGGMLNWKTHPNTPPFPDMFYRAILMSIQYTAHGTLLYILTVGQCVPRQYRTCKLHVIISILFFLNILLYFFLLWLHETRCQLLLWSCSIIFIAAINYCSIQFLF